MSGHAVLLLGGYGFFGRRIAEGLRAQAGLRLLIGGRDAAKAAALCVELGLPPSQAVRVDATDAALAQRLRELGVHTLVHSAGPFQAQDYAVAQAAIAAGSHYLDLADGRDFVAGIGALDAQAKRAGVSVISGASSVPGLSSAVVARYAAQFSQLETLRIGIASGGRTPGLATLRAIFGYCGKPIRRWENGHWMQTHGWLDLQRHAFPAPVGARWLGSCEVPDLELFPRHYPSLRTVTFHAGVAGPGHLATWLLSQLVRLGLLRSLAPLAAPLHRLNQRLEPLLTDSSAMFVELGGKGLDGAPLTRTWNLLAARHHGPQVPCGAAIALVRKLARGDSSLPRGAMPCMGLLTVEEYLQALAGLELRELPPPP